MWRCWTIRGVSLSPTTCSVTDDLKNAIIQNIRLLMSDKSRMAAATARRTGPIDELDRVVYSPCLPCVSDPMRPPAWQLTAARAVHDNIAHTIVYHDAWMDIFGLPVFYTPYFSTPDPDGEAQERIPARRALPRRISWASRCRFPITG